MAKTKYTIERWLPVVGYEGEYEVSSHGRVRSVDNRPVRSAFGRTAFRRSVVLRTETIWNGYHRVMLMSKARGKARGKFLVHRLVALAFLRNPHNRAFVNHGDGVKTNNHASNLQWVTASENAQHASRTGLYKVGEASAQAKLTEDDVRMIRREGMSLGLRAVARALGVSYGAVGAVFHHRTWRHVK